jgi:hypothetical protein
MQSFGKDIGCTRKVAHDTEKIEVGYNHLWITSVPRIGLIQLSTAADSENELLVNRFQVRLLRF